MSLAQRVIRDDPASPRAAEGHDAFAGRRASLAVLRQHPGGSDDDARRRLRIALAAALVLHALLFLGLHSWTRLSFDVPAGIDAIQLRLIDARTEHAPAVAQSTQPASASPAPLRAASRGDLARPSSPPVAPASPAPAATPLEPPARDGTAADAGPLQLLDREGGAVLPERAAEAAPSSFGPRPRGGSFVRDPMDHQSPLPYEPTRFDRYWIADDETLLDEWVRKASKQTTHDTVHGTRITCQVFLFLSACGWGPIPRVSIEELKAMRVSPPLPRNSADDPYVQPQD